MFIHILSLLLSSAITSADPKAVSSTPVCDETTKMSVEGKWTDQEFKFGSDTYILRKGPKYCYIDAKVKNESKAGQGAHSYLMLHGCDKAIANPVTQQVTCKQGPKTVIYEKNDLIKRSQQKLAANESTDNEAADQCQDFLGHEQDWPRTYEGTRPPFEQTLNGGNKIGYSEASGKCYIKNPKREKLECDEVYKISGNKLLCIHGYEQKELVGSLSDGSLVKISELMNSKLNVCNKTGHFSFLNLPKDKGGEKENIIIDNCTYMKPDGGLQSCIAIWLKEEGLHCQPKEGKEVFLRPVSPMARIEMYNQFLQDDEDDDGPDRKNGKITVKTIRHLISQEIFVPKDKRTFEKDTGIEGQPEIREPRGAKTSR